MQLPREARRSGRASTPAPEPRINLRVSLMQFVPMITTPWQCSFVTSYVAFYIQQWVIIILLPFSPGVTNQAALQIRCYQQYMAVGLLFLILALLCDGYCAAG